MSDNTPEWLVYLIKCWYICRKKRESMDIQSVPKIGISSVVHSKHIDADHIDVMDNDIALFDTESVISLYNGSTKLEVLTVGLCLEGTGAFNISLREFELSPGLMVIALPSQIIEQRCSLVPILEGIFLCCIKEYVGGVA